MKTTTTTTEKTGPKRILRKVSAEQIKLADKPKGFEFEGKFIGIHTRQYIDKEGEEKTLHTLVIENDKGERVKMLADAGLRTNLEDSLITAGDWFKAVKGDKISIGSGRTMNQWDIFQYATEN